MVDGADRRRPADDLAAALPHQRAGLLDARLGRRAGQPGAAAAVLGQHVHRLGPPPRRDRVQRDRRDARDPHAPARAARRRRQPAAAVLHGPVAAEAAPARDRGAASGCEIVCGYAMSESPYGTIWPHGTRPYGTLGTHPPAPDARPTSTRARVMRDGGRSASARWASCELRNPAVMRGYWGMPEETAAVLAADGWLRTGDLVTRQRGRHLHVRRPREGGHPAAGREPRARRGRGGARRASRRSSRRRWSACRRSCPRRRSRRSSCCTDGRGRPGRRCGRRRRASGAASRCRATWRRSPSCRTRRPAASPSTSCRASARDAEIDFERSG